MARDIAEIATHLVLAIPVSHNRLNNLNSTLESVICSIEAEGMLRWDEFSGTETTGNLGMIYARYDLVISPDKVPTTYPGVRRTEDHFSVVIPLEGANRNRVPEILGQITDHLKRSINEVTQEVRGTDGNLLAIVDFKPKLMRSPDSEISR